jgi:dCMP deaminase
MPPADDRINIRLRTDERLHRDELYSRIAALYAQRSTCLRGHVGVVLVRDGRPVGAGYNGAPSGAPTCLEVGCEHGSMPAYMADVDPLPSPSELLDHFGCQRAIHAEANAVAWAARHGISLAGAEMYSTHAPCKWCAQLIVAAEIRRFVYAKPYRAERLDLLEQADIKVIQLGY